jgi:hypothetical protein
MKHFAEDIDLDGQSSQKSEFELEKCRNDPLCARTRQGKANSQYPC